MLSIGAKNIVGGVQVAIFFNDLPIFGAAGDDLDKALKHIEDTFGKRPIKKLPVRGVSDTRMDLFSALSASISNKSITLEQLLIMVKKDYGVAGLFAVESCDIPPDAFRLGYDYIVDMHLAPHLEEELIASDQLN